MITQKVRIQYGVTTDVYFTTLGIFSSLKLNSLTTYPAWLTETLIFGGIKYLTISNTAPLGEYTFYFTNGAGSPPGTTACLIIQMVESFTDSLSTCNNSNAINIVWINREGGRSSYIFDQRKNFSMTIGESKTIDNNGEIKYYYRGKNFDSKVVYKKGLTNNEIDLIQSLKYSIQAWEYNETTDVFTPIILESTSFDKYNTKNKMNEVIIRYRLATYKEIQSQ